ncbi:MAG: hypothetical protein ABJU19_26645 [Roseobacter sp.]
MAPQWRGAAEAEGPDRTLVEVAARLSEEATKRLDKTPERDALAFLEMFDIAPPQPVAARGVSVFALKEGQSAPVLARARSGVAIATQTPEGGTANFETTEDLRIQPGGIAHLATVDPATDRLGLAPGAATTLEPDLTEKPVYSLLTSVGADEQILSIDPPVGILPGDLLRIEVPEAGVVFATVVAFSEDGLAQLDAPLGTALPEGAPVERMQQLDAFAMPDAQEHALYIGDADGLAVKEPATFTLRFDPAPVAAALAGAGAIFEIWGTRETPVEEDAPGWHPLVRLSSAAGSDLKLLKAWAGAVDELEIAGRTSRWIRVRPRDPITPLAGETPLSEATMVDKITFGLVTDTPVDADNETVSQVAYNAAPLSVTAPFLPFGPEPLRFDSFAIAAPEAFTKPGAIAALDFTLMDGTLLAMTASQRFDGRLHVYGIASNGRLQALDVTGETQTWAEVAGPPTEPGAEQVLSLDPAAGILAYAERDLTGTRADDMVVVTATTGARFVGRIERRVGDSVTDPVRLGAWFPLPALPDGALASEEIPALAVLPHWIADLGRYRASLLAATQNGVALINIPFYGSTAFSNWSQVGPVGGPALPVSPQLALVASEAEDDSAYFLTVAEDGQVWALRTDPVPTIWTALEAEDASPLIAAGGVRPAGLYHGPAGSRRLAVATLSDSAGDLQLSMTQYDVAAGGALIGAETRAHAGATFAPETVLSLSRRINLSTEQYPHVLGLQVKDNVVRSFEWSPRADVLNEAATDAVFAPPEDQAGFTAALFGPNDTQLGARQVFAAADQTTVSLGLNPSVAAIFADWVPAPTNPAGTRVVVTRINGTGEPEVIDSPEMLSPVGGGTPVAAFDQEAGADRTDWDEDVNAYRASNDLALDYDSAANALVATSGDGLGGLAGSRIMVIPNGGPPRFGIFDVQATGLLSTFTFANPPPNPDPEALQVVDMAGLDTLIGAQTGATVREVVLVHSIPGGSSAAHHGTLLRLGAVPYTTVAVSGFQASGTTLPVVQNLTGASGPDWITLGAFSGPVPDNFTLVKLLSAEAAPEKVTATALTQSYSNPDLSWEYFDGEGWKRLDDLFRDTTLNFASTGTVSFRVPRGLSMVEIGGQEDYWIRARLVGGDYGRPRYIVQSTPTTQEVTVSTDHMRPPEVSRVSARFDLPPDRLPEVVIARNNMRDLDQTSANQLVGAAYAMFQGAFEAPMGEGGGRALLLGFSAPLEPGLVSLFVTALDQAGSFSLVAQTLGADAQWSPAPLTGRDPTHGLLRSGLIGLSVTARPAQVSMFGKTLYWMRLQVVEGGADWAPQITGLWLNGVPVVQAETIRQELMGASQGEPDLTLDLLKPPVLAGSLELRVRERLGAEEIAALRAMRKPGALDPVVTAPNLRGDWVLWHQVASLTDQPGDARVYTLDPSGKVRFGDGQNGRLVLAGRENIRAFSYLSGGGRVETAAFAAAKPRGSIEGLETVLAPAPIAGGSEVPGSDELIARMPQVLRHAGACLSLLDIEALAQDADCQIVQARAFAPGGARDVVLLAVLARGNSRKPVYSLAQRDALRGVLAEAMTDAFRPGCLDVVSVTFVPVKVQVRLMARPGTLATLESDAKAVLDIFLHAAEGGPEGRGWPPGRAIWPNDIRRALAGLSTLDRILSVDVTWPEGRGPDTLGAHEVVTTTATRDINVLVIGEASS